MALEAKMGSAEGKMGEVEEWKEQVGMERDLLVSERGMVAAAWVRVASKETRADWLEGLAADQETVMVI